MSFERPTLETIILRIETDITSRLTGGIALLKTSLLKILAKVFAAAIHTCYGYLDYISKQILPDLATGAWLDRIGLMWGVIRIKATFAEGQLGCNGTDSIVIPEETIFVRDDGWEYYTIADVTISGGAAYPEIKAVDPGEDGNAEQWITLTIQTPIAGVNDEASLIIALTGGTDRESDEDYRRRILYRIQNPPAGAAEHDYTRIGNAVPGVDQVFVFGAQNVLTAEPGHVTVVVLGVDPKIPTADLIQDVEDALTDVDTGIVPIDIEANNGLHVESITESDIVIDVSITPNTSTLQSDISEKIQELFDDEGSPGGTILLSRLRNAIATAGPDDYEITDIEVDTVSIGVDDIVLTDFNYPILDTVNFSLLP